MQNLISLISFTFLIVGIQTTPPDTQLLRPLLLNQNETRLQTDPKIIGGSPANIADMTYQVSIRLGRGEYIFGNGHICGGSLFKLNAVLTAAHCTYYKKDAQWIQWDASDFLIVMGTLDRYQQSKNVFKSRVKRFVSNDQFNPKTMRNDIAVMFLTTPVPSNHPYAKPISLATFLQPENTTCRISGWGTTSFNGQSSSILLTAKITILSLARCKATYSTHLLPGMMCVGEWNGTRDACQGDSGGPLVCNNLLTGVVSWGNQCGLANWPGIYSDISFFQKWISINRSNRMCVNSFLILNLIVIAVHYIFK